VTLSSVEAYYVATREVACHIVWMRRIVTELLHEQQEPTQIFYDSKSSIALSRNHVFHKKTKHIDTKYHFIRELINNDEISIEFCRFEDQFANRFVNCNNIAEFCFWVKLLRGRILED
jgi:hypothetical protein